MLNLEEDKTTLKVLVEDRYEISGLAIVKVLDKKAQSTMTLKLKFAQNLVTLDVTYSFF